MLVKARLITTDCIFSARSSQQVAGHCLLCADLSMTGRCIS